MKGYNREILVCLLIAVSCLFVYNRVGEYSYILYDDVIGLNDPHITDGFSIDDLARVFSKPPDHVPYQSPVPVLVRMIQWELFGGDFGAHHLLSLYLHIITALMLFVFLKMATGDTWSSGICAVLFALHPLNVEAVCWLAASNTVLYGFFLLLTLFSYLFYIRYPSLKRYSLMFLPFVFGLLCKPTIAVLPVLLLLLDYWPLKRIVSFFPPAISEETKLHGKYVLVIEKIPFLGVVLLQFFAAKFIERGPTTKGGWGGVDFHPGAILQLVSYMKKAVFPSDLSVLQPPAQDIPLWIALSIFFVFVFISILILLKSGKHRYLVTGWFWFFVSLLPPMMVPFFSQRPFADRYFYVPLIGLFIIISFGLGYVTQGHRRVRMAASVFTLFVLLFLASFSYRQVGYWKNSITAFKHSLSIYSDNIRALVNLGDAYLQNGQTDNSVEYYKRALQFNPKDASVHTKLADVFAVIGRSKEAEEHYRKAVELSPAYVFALHNYADFLTDCGRIEEAIEYYRAALKVNSNLPQTHNNLAVALLKMGEVKDAVVHLKMALSIDPSYSTARKNLEAVERYTHDG